MYKLTVAHVAPLLQLVLYVTLQLQAVATALCRVNRIADLYPGTCTCTAAVRYVDLVGSYHTVN